MLIVYRAHSGPGWHPITYMARLAAELFEADLHAVPDGEQPGAIEKLRLLLLGRGAAEETCLVLAATPRDLLGLLLVDGWRKRFKHVVAWIIDSFWTNDIPKLLRHARLFDRIFVTTDEDVPEWERFTRSPASWLPWGSDVLRLGSGQIDRSLDLTRIGRQPPEWDDDAVTAQACSARGLRFQGRTPYFDDPDENHTTLARLYGQSKFVLAFSNTANPTNYTHPTREYLTARWVDGLAGGATIAGIMPRSPGIKQLLWDGATLELGTIDREPGLHRIAEAVGSWSGERAAMNYKKSLERLDWRLRFSEIAKALSIMPPRLEAELRQVQQAIA